MRNLKKNLEKKIKSGFTLIELLVVISIIGLLSSVVLSSLNSSRVKARNAQRIQQIRQLVNAFNLARSADSSGSLPANGGAWSCVTATCGQGWAGYTANATVDAAITPYITKPPDPIDNTRGYYGYLYTDNWSGGAGYPQGHYLDYLLEPTSSCGPAGQIWSSNSNYTQCLLSLD